MPATPQDRKAPRKTTAKRATTRRPSSATGTPEPVAGDEAYAPTAWGSAPGSTAEDLTMPSGQRALVRRPGIESLLKAGIIHDIDFLTGVVEEKHIKRVKGGRPAPDVTQILADPAQLERLTHVVDRVVCHVVVKPHVEMTPSDITRREAGVIYCDMIDLEDKLFIMNFAVGGTRDLERFRGELSESVAGLGPVAEAEDPTE